MNDKIIVKKDIKALMAQTQPGVPWGDAVVDHSDAFHAAAWYKRHGHGGQFNFLEIDIPRIPGVNHKAIGQNGSYQRAPKGYLLLDDFGATHNEQTLAQAGMDAQAAQIIYHPVPFDLSATFDTMALRCAVYAIEQLGHPVSGGGLKYYINKPQKHPAKGGELRDCHFICDGQDLLYDVIIDQSQALNQKVNRKFTYINITIESAANPFRLPCSFGSLIDNVSTIGCDNAMELRFCLQADVRRCHATNNYKSGMILSNGNWPGASLSNSQSNHSTLRDNRIFAGRSIDIGIKIEAASGVRCDGNIIEGAGMNVGTGILVDSKASSVVKDTSITRSHVELACRDSMIKLRPAGGIHIVDGVFNQYTQARVIDVDAYLNIHWSKIILQHFTWTPAGSKYRVGAATRPTWKFIDNADIPDPNNSANWEGGVMPDNLDTSGHRGATAFSRAPQPEIIDTDLQETALALANKFKTAMTLKDKGMMREVETAAKLVADQHSDDTADQRAVMHLKILEHTAQVQQDHITLGRVA